jgi:hypothetical protein
MNCVLCEGNAAQTDDQQHMRQAAPGGFGRPARIKVRDGTTL